MRSIAPRRRPRRRTATARATTRSATRSPSPAPTCCGSSRRTPRPCRRSSSTSCRDLLVALLAGGLFLGEVDLAGVALALADDLEPARREDLAPALHRPEQLLVDADLLLVERHVRDDGLLPALVGELVERDQELLALAGDVVDLDDVLEVVERGLEEPGEEDLPGVGVLG